MGLFKSKENQQFVKKIYAITGITPKKLLVYKEAFRHGSVLLDKKKQENHIANYERLEFLGDSILSALVAEMLFLRFPFKNEGFLTTMRSKIVNREQLAQVGKSMGLEDLIDVAKIIKGNTVSMKNILGNAVEALIGAVYIDRGYKATRRFVVERMLNYYMDVDAIMDSVLSYKALLLTYCQKMKKEIKFETSGEDSMPKTLKTATVYIDGEIAHQCSHKSSKTAMELCCKELCKKIGVPLDIAAREIRIL